MANWDEEALKRDEITIVVQINGKIRDKININTGMSEEEIKEKAFASEKIKDYITGKIINKTIIVQNRLVNILVK